MADIRWYHYTVGSCVLPIIAAAKIKRTTVGLIHGERKAVWFSCRPTWEPTATKEVIYRGINRYMTITEVVDKVVALVRFEVSARFARHTWADHRRIGKIDPLMADALEAAAAEQGANPDDWRVSYHDVPVSALLGLEASEDGDTWAVVGAPAASPADGLRLDPTFARRLTDELIKRPAIIRLPVKRQKRRGSTKRPKRKVDQ
jgi:hypothetical protein